LILLKIAGEKQKRIGAGLRWDYNGGMKKVEKMNATSLVFLGFLAGNNCVKL